jgi:hypothetical protein
LKSHLGFVSNSSSTSFYCSICEREEEHLGDIEFYEVDMFRCEGHHTFHRECLPEDLKTYYEENYYGDIKIPKEDCPICNLRVIPEYVLISYIKGTTDLDMYKSEIKAMFHNLEELKEYLGDCRL